MRDAVPIQMGAAGMDFPKNQSCTRDINGISCSVHRIVMGKHDRPAFGKEDRDRQITIGAKQRRYSCIPKGVVYLCEEEVPKWHVKRVL